MGRNRNTTIITRPLEDKYKLDKVTTKVKTTAVFQGIFDGSPEYAVVMLSGYKRRQPVEANEWAHLIRSLKHFEPTIFEAPKDSKWCSNCGDWVSKRGFSPKKDSADGLHPWCKTCRNEHERRMYWMNKSTERMAA